MLRAEGNDWAASEVQKLRRPSVAAWSIDQAARAEPQRVAQLFAAGESLEHAHRDATSGRAATTVRDAAQRRRSLVEELTGVALQFAETLSPNSATHRDAIEATWEAASIDPDIQDTVAAGSLAKELPRPSGFGLVAEGAAAAARPTPTPPARQKRARDDLAIRRARAARDVARQELHAAEEAVASAERALRRAQIGADDAARRVGDLEARVRTAREEARGAARDVKGAEQTVTRARTSRDRAARTVEKAERDLARQEE
jgi:hypothetical protein